MSNPAQDTLQHAIALHRSGRLAEAESLYRQILAADPRHPDALQLLGAIAHQLGHPGAAVELLHRSLAVFPDGKQALNNLGEALRALGRIDESIASFRRALEVDPRYAKAHSNLLLTLHYDPALAGDGTRMRREHEAWANMHAPPPSAIIQHANDRSPDRVLRVGYVSPDFKQHSVAFFIEPVLRAHDREQVRAFCYSNTARGDAVTERIRASADEWRDITTLSDDAAAELVRRDQIDILVDVTGHMARNRLLLFARRPAPVQVTYLGYPDTTGLPQIDYRITDARADPPGEADAHHVERLIRLPGCAWCYQPPEQAPDAAPAPPGRPITFGSFNKLPKISDACAAMWGQVLAATPESRLLVKAKSLSDPAARDAAARRLAAHGVAPERVALVGWAGGTREHLAMYHEVDVALDTFPYHGTTTTCEALWMGVPVVTLAGATHVSRVGASLLSAVGLEDLVTTSPQQYVRAATQLASNRARLGDLRAGLRERVRRSPLMDAEGFARGLESAYRAAWTEWCARP